jgi:predicted nucleic acid-binding protein
VSNYLVDVSVWAEYLRGEKPAIKERVEKLLDENRAVISGIVLAELMARIASEKDRNLLEECFLGLPFLEATREIFVAAGKMGADLRKKGRNITLSDLLIAALAKTHGLTVLTLDDRFQSLARPLGVQVKVLKGEAV